MPAVHGFPTITTVYDDTKMPFQTPGGGGAPAARQVPLSVLRNYILANSPSIIEVLSAGTTSNVSVPAGKLVDCIVITPPSALTALKIGISAGGEELLISSSVGAGESFVVMSPQYFASAATIYVSGIVASTAIKIFTR